MTIDIPWRGIIEIVGEHDTGKTIAALQVATNTKDIVFVDDDIKGQGTVRQMKAAGMEFDTYIDLARERAKVSSTPTADELLENVVMPTIAKIKQKPHKVIIWDTWRIVYSACRGHVEKNQQRYSKVVNFRGSSAIIQGLISKVARAIERDFLNDLKDSCELLVVTHHIKDRYKDNILVGVMPESSATFDEVCAMRMWLRRNHQSKVPIILFMKRPSRPVSGKKLKFDNIVPEKITPTDKHDSIWDAIAEYEKNPIQSRKPRPDETPTAEEFAALTGTLSPEQQQYLKQAMEFNKLFADDLAEARDEASSGTPQEGPGSISSIQTSDSPGNAVQMLTRAKVELGMSREDVAAVLGLTVSDIIKSYSASYWNMLLKTHDVEVSNAISNSPPEKRGTKKK